MTKQLSIKVQEILKDVYLIDPSLKKEEEKLISIIEEIIESEPNIKLDQSFVDRLKENLFLEVELMKKNKSRFNFNLNFNWKRLSYASMGVAIILLAIFILPNYMGTDKDSKDEPSMLALGERAFGDLGVDFFASQDSIMGPEGEQVSETLGLGSATEAGSITRDDLMIMPYPVEQENYKYIYQGETLQEIDLSLVSNLVYRRMPDINLARQMANRLSTTASLPINLNNFTEKELIHFNLSEEKDFGYSIAVNLSNNTISVFSNWQNWPQPYKDCYDRECIESLRLTAADMLSEDQLISLADNFIRKFGVDMSIYSSGELSQDSLNSINNPKDDPNYLYPEQLSVIYPLLIDGKEVLNNQGNKEGLQIGINLREKKVNSLNNLNFSNWQSSSYQLINDLEEITPLLERGGLNPDYYNRQQEDFIAVKLGEPKISLVKTWLASPDYSFSHELFLPCLVFPIEEKPNEYFYRQQVIIPLVKEVFDDNLAKLERNQYSNEVDILPMPRISPDQPVFIDQPGSETVVDEEDDVFTIMPIE